MRIVEFLNDVRGGANGMVDAQILLDMLKAEQEQHAAEELAEAGQVKTLEADSAAADGRLFQVVSIAPATTGSAVDKREDLPCHPAWLLAYAQ